MDSSGIESAELRDTYEDGYRKFLRARILAHMDPLETIMRTGHTANPLTDDESFAVRWFTFTPDLMIVMDDCTTDLAKLKKDADIGNLLFKGRHSLITTIIAAHADTALDPAWRTNNSVSIFTSTDAAMAFAKKPTNGVSDIGQFMRYSGRIIAKEPPYTKMIVIDQRIALTMIPQHPAFSAVSQSVRDFANKIARDEHGDRKWMDGL
jgi:hypothetical protein